MRNVTLALGVALTIASASAAAPAMHPIKGFESKVPTQTMLQSRHSVKSDKLVSEIRSNHHNNGMRKVKANSLNPSLDDLSQELITERPDGDYALYNRSCHANYVYYYWQLDDDFAGSVVELVTQDDGTVYMSNPVD